MTSAVQKACAATEEQLCKSVFRSGHRGGIVRCLVLNLRSSSMEEHCRSILVKEREKEARALDLRPVVTEVCAEDLDFLRSMGKCRSPRHLACLSRNVQSIRREGCQERVRTLAKAYADDLIDPDMEDACRPEIQRLCRNLKGGPGWGRWLPCLLESAALITRQHCKEAVVTHLEQQEKMREARLDLETVCAAELQTSCPSDSAAQQPILRCLLQRKDDPGFSGACREMVLNILEQKKRQFKAESKTPAGRTLLGQRFSGRALGVVAAVACVLLWHRSRRSKASGESFKDKLHSRPEGAQPDLAPEGVRQELPPP